MRMPQSITHGQVVGFADSSLKHFAGAVADAAIVSLHRAVAHTADPTRHPLPSETGSFEHLFASLVRLLPPERLAIGQQRVQTRLSAARPMLRTRVWRDVAAADVDSTRAVEEIVFERVGRRLMRLDWVDAVIVAGTASSGSRTVGPNVTLPAPTAQEQIAKKYTQLGGAQGFLGAPTSGYGVTPGGIGHFRHYSGGSIYFTSWTGAHEVHGAIREKWKSLGWEQSVLLFPTSDEHTAPDGTGRYNHFEGGSIYWTPATGAHEVHGAIREKWKSLGWEQSVLGYPVTDELGCPDGVGRYNHFEHGSIYWTAGTGAHEVHGAIREFWKAHGWETGYLGYPLTDEIDTPDGKGRRSIFQGGSVYWYPDHGAYAASTTPVSRLGLGLYWLQCLDETGKEALGGEIGSDDMRIGGVATGPDGKATKFGPFDLGQYNDGTWSDWQPFVLHEFTVDQDDGKWPKGFIVTMVLMEKDHGGYGEFLDKVMTKTEEVVESELAKQGAAWLGAALGSPGGPGGMIVGYIAGLVAAEVVSQVFDAIADIFDDDIFKPLTAHAVIPGPAALFPGGLYETSDNPWWAKGHDGHYAWLTHWVVS
jgi:hypothetical protein